jgi:antitoxin FitA
MASLTIRDLDDETKERLRVRAARRKRSMEEEARQILREAVAQDDAPTENLAEKIARRFRALGGIDLELPERGPIRPPPVPRK